MARTSVVTEVVEFILDGIASGRFPVGEKLPGEEQLAQLAHASRLTLREAVKTLAAQQVLNPVQGRGTFVNPISQWLSLSALVRVQGNDPAEVLLHLVEVRGFIEIGAAERFARTRTETQLEELRTHLADMIRGDEEGDVQRVMEADIAFHQVILDGSGNPFIPVALAPLMQMLIEARLATSGVPEMRQHAIGEHAGVLAAVAKGDAAGARKAMRSHMRQTADDTRRFFGPTS